MATLHLPSRDKTILSRTETRKKFDELPDWDKMMLSRAAMRALFMDNPDVILTIDKLKVISRDHKHPQNRKDPYGRKIWYLPIRYLRPEYEYTLKPKEKPTWEEMAKEYKSKRIKSSRSVTSAQKEDRKIQLCHRHFYVDEYMELMATKAKRDRLKRMQTREPYKKDRLKAQQVGPALQRARSLEEDEPDLHGSRNHYLSEMVRVA